MEMRPIDVLNNLKNHQYSWPQSYHMSESEAKICIDALTYLINKIKGDDYGNPS